MAGTASRLPNGWALIRRRDWSMAQSRSQIVQCSFVKANQGLLDASVFVEEKKRRNSLRTIRTRELQPVIKLNPVVDLHGAGKLAGRDFAILRNRNHRDRIFC